VPPGGDVVCGKFLPGGTAIGHNLFGLMMSKNIFGADVELFRPERLLECEASERLEMERVIELAFGSGRWMCAGKLVAFTQMSKVIFELLRSFEFQLLNLAKPWDEESGLFWIQQNFWVRISDFDKS
jgi:cytochrome P450